jgi:hypothetical protein
VLYIYIYENTISITKFQSNSFWILNWKIGNYTKMKLFPELYNDIVVESSRAFGNISRTWALLVMTHDSGAGIMNLTIGRL